MELTQALYVTNKSPAIGSRPGRLYAVRSSPSACVPSPLSDCGPVVSGPPDRFLLLGLLAHASSSPSSLSRSPTAAAPLASLPRRCRPFGFPPPPLPPPPSSNPRTFGLPPRRRLLFVASRFHLALPRRLVLPSPCRRLRLPPKNGSPSRRLLAAFVPVSFPAVAAATAPSSPPVVGLPTGQTGVDAPGLHPPQGQAEGRRGRGLRRDAARGLHPTAWARTSAAAVRRGRAGMVSHRRPPRLGAAAGKAWGTPLHASWEPGRSSSPC